MIGWLGYSNEKMTKKLKIYMSQGWNHFKIKVGQDMEDDIRRCKCVREVIGKDRTLVSLFESYLNFTHYKV